MAAAAPAASFTFSPSNPSPGDTVTFTSTSSGDVGSRVWDIAGHPAPDSDTVSAVFVNPGTYRVRLTVIDSLGASSTARQTVTVGAIADFSASPSNPAVGESVTFKSRSSGDIAGEEWDFDGDGNTDAIGSTADFTYDSPGHYKATLRVTDRSGHTSTATKSIDVISPTAPPSASFSVSPTSAHVGQPVDLRSKSTDPNGDIVQESWDLNGDGQFGDATGSTAQTRFATPGRYD